MKAVNGLKICAWCRVKKSIEEFSISRSQPDGLHSYCRQCSSTKTKLWARDNPDRKKAKVSAWRRAHPENNRAASLRWKKNHPERARASNRATILKRKYNLTPEQYDALAAHQNDQCAICGRNRSEFKNRLHVDHNHKTGKVRQLLCPNCNRAIGNVKESEDILLRIVDYLRRHR